MRNVLPTRRRPHTATNSGSLDVRAAWIFSRSIARPTNLVIGSECHFIWPEPHSRTAVLARYNLSYVANRRIWQPTLAKDLPGPPNLHERRWCDEVANLRNAKMVHGLARMDGR